MPTDASAEADYANAVAAYLTERAEAEAEIRAADAAYRTETERLAAAVAAARTARDEADRAAEEAAALVKETDTEVAVLWRSLGAVVGHRRTGPTPAARIPDLSVEPASATAVRPGPRLGSDCRPAPRPELGRRWADDRGAGTFPGPGAALGPGSGSAADPSAAHRLELGRSTADDRSHGSPPGPATGPGSTRKPGRGSSADPGAALDAATLDPAGIRARLSRSGRLLALARQGELPIEAPRHTEVTAAAIGAGIGALAVALALWFLRADGSAVRQGLAALTLFLGVATGPLVLGAWLSWQYRVRPRPGQTLACVGAAIVAVCALAGVFMRGL